MALHDVSPAGVTVDHDTGRRFVLDSARGLYELSSDGSLTVVLALADFPAADVPVRSAFTDVASLGNNQFALTARSFGYLLDLDAGTLTRFFCYVPPMMDEEMFDQSTLSLGLDPVSGVLYSQPQTLDLMNGEQVVASQVGRFDAVQGADLSWFDFRDTSFLAGGLAVLDSDTLLLGVGSRLFRYGFEGDPVADADLRSLGVASIDGMAMDAGTGTLLVVDAEQDRLIEVRLD
jgi:hypothetical protein